MFISVRKYKNNPSAIALFRIQYSVIQFFFKPLHG